MRRAMCVAFAVALSGVVARDACANSILVVNGYPTVTGTGPYTWTYQERVTNDAQVQTNDFFVIVDFNGFVSGSNAQPANWSFATVGNIGTLTGSNQSLTPTNNPAIPDLVWTYTGTPTIVGEQILGNFSAQSIYGQQTVGVQVGMDHTISPNLPEVNGQNIFTPAVPVPAAVWGGVSLLGMLGGGRLWKRRREIA